MKQETKEESTAATKINFADKAVIFKKYISSYSSKLRFILWTS